MARCVTSVCVFMCLTGGRFRHQSVTTLELGQAVKKEVTQDRKSCVKHF